MIGISVTAPLLSVTTTTMGIEPLITLKPIPSNGCADVRKNWSAAVGIAEDCKPDPLTPRNARWLSVPIVAVKVSPCVVNTQDQE